MSKTQSWAVRHVSDVMKLKIKLLAHKTWNSVVLEYLLKYKYDKDVSSAMDIITTLSTQEIMRHNKCQMRYFDVLVLKQDVDKKLMINENNCSMLNSPYTYDDEKM